MSSTSVQPSSSRLDTHLISLLLVQALWPRNVKVSVDREAGYSRNPRPLGVILFPGRGVYGVLVQLSPREPWYICDARCGKALGQGSETRRISNAASLNMQTPHGPSGDLPRQYELRSVRYGHNRRPHMTVLSERFGFSVQKAFDCCHFKVSCLQVSRDYVHRSAIPDSSDTAERLPIR